MNDVYKYEGLSEKDIETARIELNEDPKQVNAHIESFRRWVKSMPHLHCPTDSRFLLMFLRVAKFDHAKAEKRLDNFCTVRSSARGCPDYFDFPKITDEVIEKCIRTHQNIPLGRLANGECLVFAMLKFWDPKEIPTKVTIKIMLMAMEILLRNELVQIYGMKTFMDFDSSGKKVYEAWSDPKVIKSLSRIWQDCYPVRFKGEIVYKEPTWYSIVYNVMEFFLSEKNRKRIFRVKDDIKKAFETFPGLDKLLPKEYSGTGPPIEVNTEKWLKEFKDFYQKDNDWSTITVNENKRPAETIKYLIQYADYTGENVGTPGTFTKFDAL